MNEQIRKFLKENGFKNLRLPIRESIYSANIAELPLSVRATNICKRCSFNTIEDIINNVDTLRNASGSGIKAVREILNSIIEYQLTSLDDDELNDYLSQCISMNM